MEPSHPGHELERNVKSIRAAQTHLIWALIACLVFGSVIIYTARSAVGEAQEERPETTIREVRFDLIEIKSEKYKTLQSAVEIMNAFGSVLTWITVGLALRLLLVMKLDVPATVFCALGILFPCTSIFFTIYLFFCAHQRIGDAKRLKSR